MDAITLAHRIDTLPFHSHLGAEVLSVGRGWSLVRLADRAEIRNYFGDVQGAAMYAAAEAAASAAVAGLLDGELAGTSLTVAGSSIVFCRPARGELMAHASLSEQPGTVLRRIEREGATALAVIVKVEDRAHTEAARVEFDWRVNCRARHSAERRLLVVA